MVIFHSYVSLPEGIFTIGPGQTLEKSKLFQGTKSHGFSGRMWSQVRRQAPQVSRLGWWGYNGDITEISCGYSM